MSDTPLTEEKAAPPNAGLFSTVPIEITISVGKARPLIKDLLSLGENAVLPLDTRVDDPVELFVGDRLVARGELEELEGENAGQLAVRLTEITETGSQFG
ncbi:FliM/FliN family flagellar motor C-terminal domain-containing protein [Lentibacter algarum]|uniref:FliM/FliN family flagellar motor switch protein n=1 Tax=Lentibacter algarum TaxID=576131 RepID=UPI001C0743B2|nr:FliM/FliN family flagellar motor switch protein [Lentibacter algarum]MBU2981185.1 FliM/FliN family flagellar motor C-terminal domain-containing protein [Lentibacter algarum]